MKRDLHGLASGAKQTHVRALQSSLGLIEATITSTDSDPAAAAHCACRVPA